MESICCTEVQSLNSYRLRQSHVLSEAGLKCVKEKSYSRKRKREAKMRSVLGKENSETIMNQSVW